MAQDKKAEDNKAKDNKAKEKKATRTMLGIAKVFMGIVLSVIFYTLVIIGITKLCDVVYDFSYQVFGEVRVQEAPGVDVDFVVGENESNMQVATRLERAKLVVNRYSFYIRAQLTASGKGGEHIKPGSYELNTSMTYAEIMSVLTGSDKDKEETVLPGVSAAGTNNAGKDSGKESGKDSGEQK